MKFKTVIKTYKRYQVQRKEPVNLKEKDERLFEHEFKREFSSFKLIKHHNCWIDSGGSIANWRFHISPESLVNLRISPNEVFKRALQTIKLIAKKSKSQNEAYIWITERWSHGYFHWLCDALTRYYLRPEYAPGLKILLPEHYSQFPYIQESLEYLGIKFSYISRGTKIRAPKIILPQPTSSPGNYFPPAIINLSKALRANAMKTVGPKRIFVSRKKAKIRTLLNENECAPILKKYGFQTIVLEDHSFQEQMSMMGSVEVIMGVHGAGLTNMLACHENTKVIEIRGNDDASNNCFFSLSSALNFDYYYLLAESNPTNNDIVGNVTLNPAELEDFFRSLFPSNPIIR